MRHAFRAAALVLAATSITAACSSPRPESPWAAGSDIAELPDPDPTVDAPSTDSGADPDRDPDPVVGAVSDHGVELLDHECFLEEVRCGLAAVPQLADDPDRVTLEFRVLAEGGDGTPVVHLLDGTDTELPDPADYPDRPVVVVGSRGLAPGGPGLSCPEFWVLAADAANEAITPAITACRERLERAGIRPEGTLPEQLGIDVGLALRALGYEEVDLVAPRWRAVSVPAIATEISVRRVVYPDPWFEAVRPAAVAESAHASMLAVWARCETLTTCSPIGTVDDFLASIADLDRQPLDDVHDAFSDDPTPIDADRLVGAIIANAGRTTDLAFLPRLHEAVSTRDGDTVSAYVGAAAVGSDALDALAIDCGFLAAAGERTDPGVPSPLLEWALDGMDLLEHACAVWPSAPLVAPPLPGLSVVSRSMPTEGTDRRLADAAGPLIVEPTVGTPSPACVHAAARAWFDDESLDDSRCRDTFDIGDRDATISLAPGFYDAGDAIIELPVPEGWTDSGYGVWWRNADPLDGTNVDVYLWDAVDAAAAREQFIVEWGLTDPVLASSTIGAHRWLLASAEDEYGTATRTATARIDGRNVMVVLQTEAGEMEKLTDTVLFPALAGLELR